MTDEDDTAHETDEDEQTQYGGQDGPDPEVRGDEDDEDDEE